MVTHHICKAIIDSHILAGSRQNPLSGGEGTIRMENVDYLGGIKKTSDE
jgi:hypothetical protein